MNSQQTRSSMNQEICEKLSNELIMNLGCKLIEEISGQKISIEDIQDEELFDLFKEQLEYYHIVVRHNLHYYDYCRIYSEKLEGVLDPFVILQMITASTLNLPKCIEESSVYRIPVSEKLKRAFKTSHQAVKELFKNDELRRAIEQGVDKLIGYISKLDNCIRFEQDKNSSITVCNVDSILFYRSRGSLMVYRSNGNSIVEYKLNCPLSSWVKGYLRLLLHKLVFVFTLKEMVNRDRVDLADLYMLYVHLLSRDDREIIVENHGLKEGVFNLVGVLMGCGGFASLLRIHRVPNEPGYPCVYILGAERERVPFAVSLIQQYLHGFFEERGVRVKDVAVMLEHFDDVVAMLASWASSALNNRGYRFLPLTAGYPRIHGQLPSQYVFSKTRSSEADVKRYLKVFLDLLRSYALYLVSINEGCRR